VTTFSLTVVDDDPDRADRLIRGLRDELRALDVDRADFVFGEAPSGAKADAGTITAIVVALSSSPVLVQLVHLLRDWVNRGKEKKIVVRQGDRSVEITGVAVEDDWREIENFFSRSVRANAEIDDGAHSADAAGSSS
jgi:hypothetical protein